MINKIEESGCADWILAGDFNYIIYPSNRNDGQGDINHMMKFNDAISSLALVEIPLKGRKFTWSNMQHAPLLEKIDWVFTSECWTLKYPNTLVLPLAKPISDHIPFVISLEPASQDLQFSDLNFFGFSITTSKKLWQIFGTNQFKRRTVLN